MPLRAFLEGQGIISLEYSDDPWTELKSKIKKQKIPLTLSCCNQVGFIVGINANGRLVILGGNQGPSSNGVNYGTKSESEVVAHGYRYPAGYTPNYNLPKYNIKGHVITFQNSR